jgi:hypothetical protein
VKVGTEPGFPSTSQQNWKSGLGPHISHISPFTRFCAGTCAGLFAAACAMPPPSGAPRDDAPLKASVHAVLERRGLGPDALSVIDNVIRHDGTPPPAAPPIVRELLAEPLAAADAASLFDRAVPGALRHFVDEVAVEAAAPLDADASRIPLRELLDSYLGELAEAQRVLRSAARGDPVDTQALIAELRENPPSASRMNEIAAAYDEPALRRAATLFLDATARFVRALRENGARIEFPERAARFDSAVGVVMIGTRGEDVHWPGAAVIVDPGGNDTYLRAPAADGATSVIVDLGGDDRYRGSDLVVHGLSAIVDFSGNDVYAMAGPGLGAAIAGASIVADFSGDDRYAAELFGEGAAALGLGAIVDLAGNDTYRLRAGGQGFGLVGGVGLLWDRAGNDTYITAGLPDTYGRGGGLSFAQGAAFGYRALIGGGIGILRDDAGDDRYEAEMYAQGAGYYYALGLLWDRGGSDRYGAVRYAQGAGVHEAIGVLRDDSGADRYELSFGVGQGMGLDLAVGVLADAAGDDRYRAGVLAQGTATANGVGIVFDGGGADEWHVDDTRRAWGSAEWFRGLPTLGLLVYDPVRAVFLGKEGALSPPPEAARVGGPLGDAPVRHEPESARRCPDAAATATPFSMSLANALRELAPAFAGGAFEPGVYADVQRRLTARLEESLAELPRGDFEVAWSLSEALRCSAAAASAGDAQAMWDAMERVLAAEPATPFAGAIVAALRERPAPPQQMERILAALDAHPSCGLRSAALRLRGAAGTDKTARDPALSAAQAALRSPCWRLQASALAVLKQLGVAPADSAALPTFLRGAGTPSPGRGGDLLLEQLEIRRAHLDLALVDPPVDLEHGVVERRRDAELPSLARHDAGDELHLALAALDVVVDGRGARAAPHMPHQGVAGRRQVLVAGAREFVRTQAEDRLDAVAERGADRERLAADPHGDVGHAGNSDRLAVAQSQQPVRPHGHGVGDELRPLRAVDVAGHLAAGDVGEDGLDFLHARGIEAVELADREPGALVRGVALDQPRREDLRGELDAAAHGAVAADNGGDRVVVHPVHDADQHPVALEVGLDEFRQPAVVVRLHREKYDVELEVGRGEIAQVVGADRHLDVAVRHLDVETGRLQCLHLRRPLVDDRDVVARLGQVGGDAAADRAGAEHRYFPAHDLDSPGWSSSAGF